MKYVLQFTLPSGRKCVASRVGTKFALSPLPENGIKTSFIVFESTKKAWQFLKDIREKNPGKAGVLMLWKPEAVPVIITEVGIFPALANKN